MTKARPWTEEEDNTLRELYLTTERKEIARILGRTIGSLRKRCSVLGLNHKHPAVTDEERECIREWYAVRAGACLEDFGLDELAIKLGRTKQYICRLAGEMGITVSSRPFGEKMRKVVSENAKRMIAEKGHPRGMLGKKHTDEFKKWQSEHVKARVFTPEQTARRVEKAMKTKIERYGTGNPTWLTSSNPYSRTKSGKREDLGGRFFRSSWEANYARYLNWLIDQGQIESWDFECKTFVFAGVTRGVISYTPDFKVTNLDGSHEWHEVKGWMDAKSKAKLKRMAKYYPDEKVILIDRKAYQGIAKWKSLITGWEHTSV